MAKQLRLKQTSRFQLPIPRRLRQPNLTPSGVFNVAVRLGLI